VSYEVIVERRARKAIARLPSAVYGRVVQAMTTSPTIRARDKAANSRVGRDDASALVITGSSKR
jgi:hypothetical protein